jgi:enamine deaminase RidA (YjgF/YER057c/UK114 family)
MGAMRTGLVGAPGIVHRGSWDASRQTVRLEQRGRVTILAGARPAGEGGGFEAQARSMYESLGALLQEEDATPADVVSEKIFLDDLGRDFAALREIRARFYGGGAGGSGIFPATTFVQQPPCLPGRMCELQVRVAMATGGGPLAARRVASPEPDRPAGVVVEQEGRQHVFLANIVGQPGAADGAGFVDQAEDMFGRARALLAREGLSFHQVIRTWIYLRDMDRDYDAFNEVRNRFYRKQNVGLLPASTGIQATPHPAGRLCSLDIYAVGGGPPLRVEAMHAPTLNEAPRYRSAFSRGLRLDLEEETILYVSGTASIDAEGKVAHPGDFEGQVRRMLLNLENLLGGQGAGFDNGVCAVTYLKDRRFLEPFRSVCRRRGLPEQLVNTIVVADVCRPDWLCEMELTAALPRPWELCG